LDAGEVVGRLRADVAKSMFGDTFDGNQILTNFGTEQVRV
jgi:hypothetical protein